MIIAMVCLTWLVACIFVFALCKAGKDTPDA